MPSQRHPGEFRRVWRSHYFRLAWRYDQQPNAPRFKSEVIASEADSIAEMLTDDVVVVHGNGRCVCGKEAVRADFLEGFKRFAIDQKVSPTEVIVGEKWAFEISEVESELTPTQGGQQVHARSITVVVLSRQSDASWRVCRVLGLLDWGLPPRFQFRYRLYRKCCIDHLNRHLSLA